jgi:hypothetical protein
MNIKELIEQIKENFRFNKQELVSISILILITAFIFSFRDWGNEIFDLGIGLSHWFTLLILAGITFFFRMSCQKIYGLSQGHKAEFKVWWAGLLISFLFIIISGGYVPIILSGAMITSFMVRQRLGEFRYGFSYGVNGTIALWGILGNLILAVIFAIGNYFFPQNYFFTKGLILNVIMAFCALIPLPQLDGLNLFFGSRTFYVIGIFATILTAVLLLTGTKIGLILAIVLGLTAALIYILIGSEK